MDFTLDLNFDYFKSEICNLQSLIPTVILPP